MNTEHPCSSSSAGRHRTGRYRWRLPDLSWATAHLDLALAYAMSATGFRNDQSPDQGFRRVRPLTHRTIVIRAKPIDSDPPGGPQT
jgi:hypothetical protein